MIKNFLFNKKINICFSKFFLISLSFSKLSFNQIESFRRVIVRKNLKFCFFLNRSKPFFYLTKKSKKSRMGKGVGKLDSLILNLRPGYVVFEVMGAGLEVSIKSIRKALKKLPGKYKIIRK